MILLLLGKYKETKKLPITAEIYKEWQKNLATGMRNS